MNPLRWPHDPSSLGLTELDCATLSDIITIVRSRIGGALRWQCVNLGEIVSAKDGHGLVAPRKVIVHLDFSIVQLKIPIDQKVAMQVTGRVWQKFAYDPDHGEILIKKNILEPNQYLLLQYLKDSPSRYVKNGLSKIVYFSTFRGKYRYFQKYYIGGSLAASYLKGGFVFNQMAILELQNALMRIHELSLTPARIESQSMKNGLSLGLPCAGYHGNISPSHIFCEGEDLKLAGFSAALRTHVMTVNWGWSSPETIKAFISDEEPSKFNTERGAKADVWSFALIVAAFVMKSFHTDPRVSHLIFPPLPCIYTKIKIDEERGIETNAIADLTQEEIDRDLESIKPSEEEAESYTFWSAAKEWLQVDPDKRPPFSKVCIDLSDQVLV